jgi:hypothetical protein
LYQESPLRLKGFRLRAISKNIPTLKSGLGTHYTLPFTMAQDRRKMAAV